MSETCFRIRYPPYAGPLHLTDFQRTTLALGLCICSYGLAKAILTVTWHLEKNCSSSRYSEADNIGPFVVLCIIVLLQNCTVALRYNNAALSKIFHYMCSVHVLCTHALICSSLMCCNRQCARTDILHPQPSSYIAFCMYCHMCQCASAIYSLNWISMATHALPLGFQRRTLIAATNTRRNFFHTSSSRHSFYLPASF